VTHVPEGPGPYKAYQKDDGLWYYKTYDSKEIGPHRSPPELDVPYVDREETQRGDEVNHPSHYTSHPSGVECIDITRHHNFNIGNAIKYLWRQGLKDSEPALTDLKKAAWYLADEIARIEKTRTVVVRAEPMPRLSRDAIISGRLYLNVVCPTCKSSAGAFCGDGPGTPCKARVAAFEALHV
jgi:hypothetical protein